MPPRPTPHVAARCTCDAALPYTPMSPCGVRRYRDRAGASYRLRLPKSVSNISSIPAPGAEQDMRSGCLIVESARGGRALRWAVRLDGHGPRRGGAGVITMIITDHSA